MPELTSGNVHCEVLYPHRKFSGSISTQADYNSDNVANFNVSLETEINKNRYKWNSNFFVARPVLLLSALPNLSCDKLYMYFFIPALFSLQFMLTLVGVYFKWRFA